VDTPDVSIIIPCYKGALFVADSLRSLHSWTNGAGRRLGQWECVFVDDGSADGTGDVAASAFPGVHLVRLWPNQGKGAAVRAGMLAARGRYRFFTDADLPFGLDILHTMHRLLTDEACDIVTGARNRDAVSRSVQRSLLRQASSGIFTFLVAQLAPTGVRDTQCGIKGFSAAAAVFLFGLSRCNGFAFDVEILYLARKYGFKVKSVPVTLMVEKPSTVSVFRDGLGMAMDAVAMPIRCRLGYYEPKTGDRERDRGG